MVTDKPQTLSSAYNAQHRGAHGDYNRYFADMDVTMKQKLAFIGAHFLLQPGAVIADMGCGSGLGSYQLALLNPHIQVVGIDINPEMIAHARGKYPLPNLRFEVGDVENPDPTLGPFDGILNSSVLHHVYTFTGYDKKHVVTCLENQLKQINTGGQIVIRDFMAWPDDRFCFIDLSAKGTGNDIQNMSDADLLVKFSKEAKPLTPEKGTGFFIEECDCPHAPEQRRFRLSMKWAAEFLLRKDYRDSWDVEVLEDYGFWTREEYKKELEALGGRVLYTAPFWNSWIVENRFRGKAQLYHEDGTPMDYPPTNFIAVIEKINPGESLRIEEKTTSDNPKNYLTIKNYTDDSGTIFYEMAERSGAMDDIIPYTIDPDGQLYVLAKHGYPRPIVNTVPRQTPVLDQKNWSGHMIEALGLHGTYTFKKCQQNFADKLNIPKESIVSDMQGLHYFPSPGISNEHVHSHFIKVDLPTAFYSLEQDPRISGFSTSGDIRRYRAQDLLRSAQVGVLSEVRLELNIYRLMQTTGMTPDSWIGGEIFKCAKGNQHFPTQSLENLLKQAPQKIFTQDMTNKKGSYLRHLRSIFADRSAQKENAHQEYEFVIPGLKGMSANVAAVMPVAKSADGEWYVGIEHRNLPSFQDKTERSDQPVLPAYRLPVHITSTEQAALFIGHKMGVDRSSVSQLGEGYFSSTGLTPERIFPFIVEVDPNQLKEPLTFVPLKEVFQNIENLHDAHLMISAMRGVHALKQWESYTKDQTPAPKTTTQNALQKRP